jgi:hypothetical protein
MPSQIRPSQLTPEERRRRLAALLATGLLRLGAALKAPSSCPPEPPENSTKSSANRLADAAQKSVTVSAG